MLVYLEAAGLSLNDHRYRQVSGSQTYAASNRAPRRRRASIFSRAIAAVKAYAERQRLANDLYRLSDRLLADAGFTREDIPAVVNGTFVRQPEPAPTEHPSAHQVRVTGGTAATAANDNKIQVAA